MQVGGGTDPTRALAQQLPQLVQGLGLIGVAASVVIAALPSLWSLFTSGEEDIASLEKQLEGARKVMDAYSSAADLAAEPMSKLTAKYGEQAEAVRKLRIEQAELRRGDAARAVNDLMTKTQGAGGGTGNSAAEIAQALQMEQRAQRFKEMTATLSQAEALAQGFDFNAEWEALQRMGVAIGEVRTGIAGMAADYGITFDQAANVATALDRVRDSAGQSAAEQVAASQALSNYLVEVFGSADAANQATKGLVNLLNQSAQESAEFAAIDTASGIVATAVAAGGLVTNLSAAVALQYQLANMPGAAVRGLDDERGSQGEARRSAAEYNSSVIMKRLAPARAGGGGGGGVDSDLARAKALTEGVRSETEKYAESLAEVDRLKAKGLITDETYNRQLDKLQDKLGQVGDLGKEAASAIRSAFDGLFDDPEAALKDLAKQLAMMAVYQGLGQAFPKVFGSGGFMPLGVKGFAGGGMHAGGLRIVGENGPELEATGPSMIYPNSALRGMGRGGGGTSVQVINNSGQPARTEASQGPNGREMVRVIVGEEIARGRMDKPMRGRFGSSPNKVIR